MSFERNHEPVVMKSGDEANGNGVLLQVVLERSLGKESADLLLKALSEPALVEMENYATALGNMAQSEGVDHQLTLAMTAAKLQAGFSSTPMAQHSGIARELLRGLQLSPEFRQEVYVKLFDEGMLDTYGKGLRTLDIVTRPDVATRNRR